MTYADQEKSIIVAQYQQGTSAQELSKNMGYVSVPSIAGQKSIVI